MQEKIDYMIATGLDISTAGTIIPSYQWGATLTGGVVSLSGANNIVIEKVSNTQTTNIGW